MELPIPTDMKMTSTAHGSGDKGMAFYSYEAHDVLLDARRKGARSPFVETWRYRWLPNAEFGTYRELRAAVAALTDEAVAAERARWPQMPAPPALSGSRGTGNCWLHGDRPRTYRGWVQTCWHKYDGLTAMLCEECATAAASDPGVIVRASEKRRADVAARHSTALGVERSGDGR